MHIKKREASVPPASGDLARFLKRAKLDITGFARAHGIDRFQLMRAMAGKTKRVSVDLADDIARATGGEVPAHRWRQSASRVKVREAVVIPSHGSAEASR